MEYQTVENLAVIVIFVFWAALISFVVVTRIMES